MGKIHDEVKEVIPGMGEQDKTVFEFKTDRRKFMKTGAALAASLAVPLSAVPARGAAAQAKGNAAASDFKPMTKVNCFSEDGELNTVCLGDAACSVLVFGGVRPENVVVRVTVGCCGFGDDVCGLTTAAASSFVSGSLPLWIRAHNPPFWAVGET